VPRNPDWARDELILALDLFLRRGRRQLPGDDPDVIALSNLLNFLPIHPPGMREEAFRNPNGVSMKLGNFLRFEPSYEGKGLSRGSQAEASVWAEFAERPYVLRSTAAAIESVAASKQLTALFAAVEEDDEPEFPEGKLLTRLHRSRERSRELVRKKKQRTLHDVGKLACEVCGFDFFEFYGPIGIGFAECHHTAPLAQLVEQRASKLADLVIVCANCHRMLHHHRPMLSVEALRQILQGRQPITSEAA
jgi:5-methylcytosine-specific restriction enzyme A